MNHTNVVMNRIVQNQKESHSIHGLQRQPCVFLSNLPLDAYEGTIRHAFEQEDIKMAGVQLLQKGSFNRRRNSGLACVTLTCEEDVERCCQLLDGKILQVGADSAAGRPMIVRGNKFVEDHAAYGTAATPECEASSPSSNSCAVTYGS